MKVSILTLVSTPEHQNAGALLHDRIIGALERCCRRGKMLLIQNKRVTGTPARSASLPGKP
jgi:hypothetical protein